MKRALVLLAPGFEEIEAVTVIDILRRTGIEVTVAGTVEGPIEGAHKMSLLADCSVDQISGKALDLVVLPGGQPGTRNLSRDPRVKKILAEVEAHGGILSAICAAPSILASYGYISGKQATSHPSVRSEMGTTDYSEERVVVDARRVTSRAPGTAMEFAFELVRSLLGEEQAEAVNQGVMARL